MQSIQKYTIIFSGLAVFLFLGYIAIQHPDSSQADESKEDARVSSSISQSGIETDTGKRLTTLAQSGSDWGMSPFGSGKPLEEVKKLEFKKPNTEWKTRTHSGITYVFGEGNPKEVALTTNDLKKDATDKCPEDTIDPKRIFCTESSGYVSPEVEKYLLAALSDPNWVPLMTLCEENLRTFEPENLETPNNPSYDRISHNHFLDMEQWITIDPYTGRKSINMSREVYLLQWLIGRTAIAWNEIEWPRQSDGITLKVFKNPTCVDTYGKEIIRNFTLAITYYSRPSEVFGPVPQNLLDPNLFKIFN